MKKFLRHFEDVVLLLVFVLSGSMAAADVQAYRFGQVALIGMSCRM